MIREALLSNIKCADFHAIDGGARDRDRAAKAYEGEIRKAAGVSRGVPSMDLILLGLGEDGHTASLFEGSAALEEKKRLVAPNYSTKLKSWRMTMTFPLINRARNVVFFAEGANKMKFFAAALSGNPDCPAARVRPNRGILKYIVDEAVVRG